MAYRLDKVISEQAQHNERGSGGTPDSRGQGIHSSHTYDK